MAVNVKSKQKNKLIIFSLAILGSVLFLLLGYVFSVAFVEKSFSRAFQAPFFGHFNFYSPIFMVSGFVLSEIVAGACFFLSGNKRKASADDGMNVEMPEINKEVEAPFSHTVEPVSELSGVEDEMEPGESVEEEAGNSAAGTETGQTVEEDGSTGKDAAFFDEDLFLELYASYSVEQIKAMMKIRNYVENVDAKLLARMFSPELPAEDIASYIDIYYT